MGSPNAKIYRQKVRNKSKIQAPKPILKHKTLLLKMVFVKKTQMSRWLKKEKETKVKELIEP
jgi:hypothetical protein